MSPPMSVVWGKLSLTENELGKKLLPLTVKETVCEGETLAPGERDWIISVGPGPTRIGTLMEAMCPIESYAYTLMVCCPSWLTSTGVQEK